MKPILFNTGMVKAILDGRKTVTRRVVKFNKGQNPKWTGYVPDGDVLYGSNNIPVAKAPFRKDDVLWVRETFAQPTKHIFWYKADFKMQNILWRPSIHMPREAARIFLRVTGVRAERLHEIATIEAQQEGQPECTGGIMSCGGQESCFDCEASYQNAIRWFSSVWDSTIKSADRTTCGWDANPWVWVIEFEQISKEEAVYGV